MSPRNHADYTAVLIITGRSLLAQFGLTPKSRRGLAAGEPEAVRCSSLRCDRLAKVQPAEIAMFQISEVQESSAFDDGRIFLTLRSVNSAAIKQFAEYIGGNFSELEGESSIR
jgi:hypothetical protein